MALGGRHVTADGVLIVASRANRSQAENRRAARARLVVLLKRAAAAPKPRRATKAAPSVPGSDGPPNSSTARSNVRGAGETRTRAVLDMSVASGRTSRKAGHTLHTAVKTAAAMCEGIREVR